MAHITVPEGDAITTYLNFSGKGPVSFDWPYQESGDISVYVNDVLIPSSGWSVSGGTVLTGGISGGNITLVTAVTNAKLVITRKVPPAREDDYSVNGITPQALNTDLDRIHMILQDQSSVLKNAIVPVPGGTGWSFPFDSNPTGKLLLGVSSTAFGLVDPTALAIAVDPNLPVSAIPSFTLQTLKALPPMLDQTVVNTSGYYVSGDGGHGTYIWDASSTLADNGATVISISGQAVGRYILQHNGTIRIRQAGARDSSQTTADQSSFIQAAHDALGGAGIIWIDPTPLNTGFIIENPLICRRGRKWRGVENFSQLVVNNNFPDHGGVFEQDMTHEEGRFYKHGDHTTWLWLSGLVIDMRGKNGPCRARKIRRHFTYTDCSYLYIKGNPNYPQNSFTSYHSDKTISNGTPPKPSACFNYHNTERYVVSDDCFAPNCYEMLGLNFPGLGRLSNNNVILGGRIHGFISAVHISGHGNLLNGLLTNPPLGNANSPIHMNEANFRFMGLSGTTFSDATPNGHNVRFNFPRGRGNIIRRCWVERIDSRAAVFVDNANSSKLSGVTVDNCVAIEHPEQVIDLVNPLGFRAVQYNGTNNQIEIRSATDTSPDELISFPKGARIVVHSFNADRRDGTSIRGHQYDGHSYTTISEAVYSGGKTIITVADPVVDQWTCGAEREDVATRIDDTTMTINGDWEVPFAAGEQIIYHKPNHGLASSTVVSRTHGPHPTDPVGYPAGITTIVTADPIVTETGGLAFATHKYNRNPFRYANKVYEPEMTAESVNVRDVLHTAAFVNGSVDGSEDCTITSGNINVNSGNIELLPQSGTADNLDKITGLNYDGAIIHLRLAQPGVDTITVRNNLGGSKAIYTNTGASVVLSAAHHEMMLRYNLTMARWVHIGGNTA